MKLYGNMEDTGSDDIALTEKKEFRTEVASAITGVGPVRRAVIASAPLSRGRCADAVC